MRNRLLLPVVGFVCAGLAQGADRQLSDVTVFKGLCDASAAVALSADMFVVAPDEGAKLRIYRQGQAEPIGHKDLTKFLELEEDDPEADIEGATWLGDRIYWICSHGRDSDGDRRRNRLRIFATRVEFVDGEVHLEGVDAPYKQLLRDLKDDTRFDRFDLDKASDRAAEAEGGLNIEGLAATSDGDLLIGFRNPVPRGMALVVRLKNPHKILEGEKANFGDPVLLDLGGRGIRSFEYVPEQERYYIVAGPPGDAGSFALYEWSGDGTAPTRIEGPRFGDLHPEALFVRDKATKEIQILGDDGDRRMLPDEDRCKKLPTADQSFRSVLLK